MKNADLALYRAKDGGRGTYHFYERGLDAALQERRSMETRNALGTRRGANFACFSSRFSTSRTTASVRFEALRAGAIPNAAICTRRSSFLSPRSRG